MPGACSLEFHDGCLEGHMNSTTCNRPGAGAHSVPVGDSKQCYQAMLEVHQALSAQPQGLRAESAGRKTESFGSYLAIFVVRV
jgi:hypothetical protein